MRSMLLAAIAALGPVLAGCTISQEEVRAEPVRFTMTVTASFDTLATCVAGRSAHDYVVTPQIYQSEGVAYVTLAAKSAPTVQSEYFIRRSGTNTSTVEWRRRKLIAGQGGSEEQARENIEACSKPFARQA